MYVAIQPRVRELEKGLRLDVGVEEIVEYLRTRNNTAAGLDDIEYDVLKRLFIRYEGGPLMVGSGRLKRPLDTPSLDRLRDWAAHAVRSLVVHGYFPDALKKGEVVPIFKSGDCTQPGNYRPITLMSCLYKLATAILAKRMLGICETAGAISHLQGSGRTSQSCVNKVALVQNVIKHARRTGSELHLFSSDIRKAFDRVPYEAFEFSLVSLGFSEPTLEPFRNLQQAAAACVRTPAGRTGFFHTLVGCRQGCSLSPLRFVLFMDLFLKHLDAMEIGYLYTFETASAVADPLVPGAAFADDLVLLTGSAEDMQRVVTELDRFLGTFSMHLNPGKCEYRTRGRLSSDGPVPPVLVHGDDAAVHTVQDKGALEPFRYLGYWLALDSRAFKGDPMYANHGAAVWARHEAEVLKGFMERAQNSRG